MTVFVRISWVGCNGAAYYVGEDAAFAPLVYHRFRKWFAPIEDEL